MSLQQRVPSAISPFRPWLLALLLLLLTRTIPAQTPHPRFRVIAIAEPGGIHKPFVDAAKVWLAKEAVRDHFSIDYIEDTQPINEEFLAQYQLFLELNYPPYRWTPTAASTFQKFI